MQQQLQRDFACCPCRQCVVDSRRALPEKLQRGYDVRRAILLRNNATFVPHGQQPTCSCADCKSSDAREENSLGHVLLRSAETVRLRRPKAAVRGAHTLRRTSEDTCIQQLFAGSTEKAWARLRTDDGEHSEVVFPLFARHHTAYF